MAYVKVTGYLEVDDSELDSGPLGPLTEQADQFYRGMTRERVPTIDLLEDLEFSEDDR